MRLKAPSPDCLAAAEAIKLLHQACGTAKTLTQSSVGLAQSMAFYRYLPSGAALHPSYIPGRL